MIFRFVMILKTSFLVLIEAYGWDMAGIRTLWTICPVGNGFMHNPTALACMVSASFDLTILEKTSITLLISTSSWILKEKIFLTATVKVFH